MHVCMYIRYISIMYICMKDFAVRDYSDGFDLNFSQNFLLSSITF